MDVARLWGVSHQAVANAITRGRLRRQPNGLIDADEARAIRPFRIPQIEQNEILRAYENQPFSAEEDFLAADILGELTPESAPQAGSHVAERLEQERKLRAFKIEAARLTVERTRAKLRAEQSNLLSRDDLKMCMIASEKVIVEAFESFVRNIASDFADAGQRREVIALGRSKIDRAKSVLALALEAAIGDKRDDQGGRRI